MADLATLGIKVDSGEAVKAEKALDNLTTAAKRTEDAVKRIDSGGTKAAEGIKKVGNEAAKAEQPVRKTGHAVQQLGFQINDLGTQIAGGGSPMQALAQQGGQIFQIWQQNPTVFKDTARAIAGALPPVRLLIGGVVAAGVAALVLGERYLAAQRDVERSLAGMGRASGFTVAGINAIAEAEANRQRISVSAAREIASAYAATGQIRGPNVGALTGATRDFAAQTGQSIEEATAQLARSFSSPAAGAEDLNKKLGFLDARTLAYIKTLEDSGRKSEAQRVLLDAMRSSIDKAADRVSVFTAAWQNLSTTVSTVIDRIGKALAGEKTLEEQLADAIARRQRLSQGLRGRTASGQASQQRAQADIENLSEQIRLQGRLARIEAEAAQNRARSLEARSITREIDPTIDQFEKIDAQVNKLRAALSSDIGRGMLENVEKTARALAMVENAQRTRLTIEERLVQEGEIQQRSILARTAAQQLEAEYARQKLQMAGQLVSPLQQELTLRNAITAAQANSAKEARDMLRSAQDQARMAGMLPYQRAQEEARIQMRDFNERTNASRANLPGLNYTPRSGAANSNTSAATGIDQAFKAKVTALIEAVGDSSARMTSGFRTYEDQVRLKAKYGAGAATPGHSAHERGQAMDYVFSSPEFRQRAIDKAADFGIRALPSNGGAVHFDTGRRGAFTGPPPVAAQRSIEDTEASLRHALDKKIRTEQITNATRDYRMELDAQVASQKAAEQAMGGTIRQTVAAAKEQEIINDFAKKGVAVTGELAQQIKDLARGYGELADRQASVKLRMDVNFETAQIGRSSGEQQIASRLRGIYGEGYTSEMNGAIANQMRFNNLLDQTASTAEGAFNTIANGFMNGQKASDIFKTALKQIASQAISMMANTVIRSLFGSLMGGAGGLFGGAGGGIGMPFNILPSANGNAFANDNLVRFAKGSAFTNKVVSRPTMFSFAKGTMLGEMGEAGPEAIVPLKRGSDGSLGVQMHGKGMGVSVMPQINVQIHNNSSGAQVQTTQEPDGTLAISVLDSHLDNAAAQATSGRGPLSGFVKTSEHAGQRFG